VAICSHDLSDGREFARRPGIEPLSMADAIDRSASSPSGDSEASNDRRSSGRPWVL